MSATGQLTIVKQQLLTLKNEAYKNEVNGTAIFTVAEDKELTISGGQEKLQDLKDGYDSLFVDPDVPEVAGGVKQADGSLVMCAQAEWDELMKQMRLKGRELFEKSETMNVIIDSRTIEDSFETIWGTTWENTQV